MDRRGFTGVLGAVIGLGLLWWALSPRAGDERDPPTPAPQSTRTVPTPALTAARRAIPTIPVADPAGPADDADALTVDEKAAHRATSEALIEGAMQICLAPWAAHEGLDEEPVTVKFAAHSTEEGLAELRVRVPDGLPSDAEDCLHQTLEALPWPALPRVGDFEQTWKWTTVPDRPDATVESVAAALPTP